MLFKKWATGLAVKLTDAAGITDSYQTALIRYKLECLFSMVLSISALFIAAFLLGVLKSAFLIAVTIMIIKSMTGGLHLGTPLRCAVLGALLIVSVSYLALYFPLVRFPIYLVIAVILLLNVIVWLKAPHESEGKPLTEKQKKYLALYSRIAVLLLSIICVVWPRVWGINELFYGLLLQGLNLLPISEHGMAAVDHILEKIEPKPLF